MYHRRVNVRGIIVKNGKLFCQTIKGSSESYWCTPGGGMDDGESLIDALKREMIEETGVTPEIGQLLLIQQFHDGAKEQLEFFFYITNADDYEHIDLLATSHGNEEIGECDFIDPSTHNVLPRIFQTMPIDSIVNTPRVIIETELPSTTRSS